MRVIKQPLPVSVHICLAEMILLLESSCHEVCGGASFNVGSEKNDGEFTLQISM